MLFIVSVYSAIIIDRHSIEPLIWHQVYIVKLFSDSQLKLNHSSRKESIQMMLWYHQCSYLGNEKNFQFN